MLAKVYPEFRRRNSLTFSHHLEVARLPEAARERLLEAAAAEVWTRAQMRDAVREVSLEGTVARQRREIVELKRRLAATEDEPRDVTAQAVSRTKAERRVARDAARRIASVAEELAGAPVLDRLHGNARRGLARALRAETGALVESVNAAVDRIEAAVAAIDRAA